MKLPRGLHPARHRLLAAWVLVGVLLAAQTLSLLHGVVHTGAPGPHAAAAQAAAEGAGSSRLQQWASAHTEGSVLCQALDHLGHADAVAPTFVLPAAAAWAAGPAAPARTARLAPRAAPYEARAPPARA
jgi:hypothetical protein